MSRELWIVEPCEHGEVSPHADPDCPGGWREVADFDAIYDRYYTAANRRFEAGLTYDELKQVVLGGTDT